jgi:pimeloyl-ACP methyl ester carboxylesterase
MAPVAAPGSSRVTALEHRSDPNRIASVVDPSRNEASCAKLGFVPRVETSDGVVLEVRDDGRGRPVLLLHGFPDSSYVWRKQIGPLVEAGFRVVTPDLRGFGASDKPQDLDAYRLTTLLADVIVMLDALGVERADVVGHDWGAVLAWLLAGLHADRVDRLVAMSVGHPNTQAELSVEQREKSWYMLWFQFEGLAEEILPRGGWRLLREWTRGNGDVERYVRELAQPGALTAGLNWYRANLSPLRELQPRREFPMISAPTMGVWSSGDDYLLEAPVKRSGEHVTGGWRYERIDGASHWPQLDAPDRVNELLVDFLG